MGVPVRGGCSTAAGAGLQADPAAAELPGPVGQLARQCGHPGPEAACGQPQLPQGRPAVPAEMVLLQVSVHVISQRAGEGEGKLRGGALTSFKMDKTIPYNTNQSLRGERISCLGEPFFSPPFSFPTFLRYHNFPSIFQDFNNVFRVTSRSKT